MLEIAIIGIAIALIFDFVNGFIAKTTFFLISPSHVNILFYLYVMNKQLRIFICAIIEI